MGRKHSAITASCASPIRFPTAAGVGSTARVRTRSLRSVCLFLPHLRRPSPCRNSGSLYLWLGFLRSSFGCTAERNNLILLRGHDGGKKKVNPFALCKAGYSCPQSPEAGRPNSFACVRVNSAFRNKLNHADNSSGAQQHISHVEPNAGRNVGC
jgi:hypothetical protein